MVARLREPVRSIVIVGGGTAGWMTAAALARHFQSSPVSITLIESSEIGTIGVGEATIPTIRRFYAQLGMSDVEVMQATQATCKLGIRFQDWSRPGSDFIHPFGLYGQELRGIGFHNFWRCAREAGDAAPLSDYSLGASLALAGKFEQPSPTPPSELSVFDWALHFDAALFAQHMRRFAEANGCRRIDAKIQNVRLRAEDGFISAVELDNDDGVEGDLFIDCSGFRALLLGEALGEPFEDWGRWLPCDAAVAMQTENPEGEEPQPFTRVTARSAGWQWGIPLRHRAGNGLVYSSAHQSEDEAAQELLANVRGAPLMEPRRIPFRPGRRSRAWVKNCIGIGLSAGFLEPLESTSIALIETAIERLKGLFPDRDFAPAVVDEFNDQSAREMDRVRDFIILHYKLNQRDDTAFWRDCREMAVPETLERKMALWIQRGQFIRYRWEMFHPASWLAIYAGFDHWPEVIDPGVAAFNTEQLRVGLRQMRDAVARAVADAPSHADFLATLDPAATRVQDLSHV